VAFAAVTPGRPAATCGAAPARRAAAAGGGAPELASPAGHASWVGWQAGDAAGGHTLLSEGVALLTGRAALGALGRLRGRAAQPRLAVPTELLGGTQHNLTACHAALSHTQAVDAGLARRTAGTIAEGFPLVAAHRAALADLAGAADGGSTQRSAWSQTSVLLTSLARGAADA